MHVKKLVLLLALTTFCSQLLAADKITILERKLLAVKTSNQSKAGEEMQNMISPYKQMLNNKLNVVIGFTTSELKGYAPESPLSNFCADALLHYAQTHNKQPVDMALLNFGGLRKALPQGPINYMHVYELMPFENKAVIITLTGKELYSIVNNIALKNGAPIAGLRLKIKNDSQIEASIQGQAIDPNKTYRIATSDYLAEGNDGFISLTKPNIMSLDIKIRELLIEEIQATSSHGKTIEANLDQRIYVEK